MNKLFVFTNQRAVREFSTNFTDALVPKAFSLDEFEQRATYVPDRIDADATQLLLLMREACAMSRATELKIPTEFFAFLKNNDYLFSFFKELATQKKSVSDLKFSDIYASFEEHIEILGQVLTNYKALLEKHGLYDEITFCELYEINDGFLKSWDEIEIEVFGFLSEHEWELLLKCAKFTRIKLKFKSSKFNRKLTSRIEAISGEAVEPNFIYELDLATHKLACIAPAAQNRTVLARSFSMRTMQVAYVFEKISTFIKDGICPSKIAVVLPDESFAAQLKIYDEKNMLSYAMGTSFEKTLFYTLLRQICETIKQDESVWLDEKALQESDLKATQSFLNFCEFKKELFEKFRQSYEIYLNFSEFEAMIWEVFELVAQENSREILREELFFVKNLAVKGELKFGELAQILLMRLGARTIDEVHGGAVRCIGVLESRGLKFDGVIIVDFNDDVVPKRSVNEMFLSSVVREKAGLISYHERENLQRFYYESLINEAKCVAVSYVKDEDKLPSRFLGEFSFSADLAYTDDEYLGVFAGGFVAKFHPDLPKMRHDFFKNELSFSRLDTFLTCARKYFYRYVCHLAEGRNLEIKSPSRYGKGVHEALHECYKKFGGFDLDEFLQILASKNLNPLELEMAKLKFQKFAQNEKKWSAQGWRTAWLEIEKSAVFEGVKIQGIIDRVDERARENGRELCVLDYKTGSNMHPLQLAFYKAILADEASNIQAYFYDLKEKMMVDTKKTGQLQMLKDAITQAREYFDGEVKFEPNISSSCQTCAYRAICTGVLR